jgi:hypothetical protein
LPPLGDAAGAEVPDAVGRARLICRRCSAIVLESDEVGDAERSALREHLRTMHPAVLETYQSVRKVMTGHDAQAYFVVNRSPAR